MNPNQILDKLRLARASDVDQIVALYRLVGDLGRQNGSSDWDDSYPSRELARADVAESALWVLDIDGAIAAAFSLHAHGEPDEAPLSWSEGNSCVLSRLCVSPERQRGGMGKAMVRAVASVAASQGYEWLRLMTPTVNLAANAMYRRLAFAELGHFELDDIDFVCYESSLSRLRNQHN